MERIFSFHWITPLGREAPRKFSYIILCIARRRRYERSYHPLEITILQIGFPIEENFSSYSVITFPCTISSL